MQAWQVVAHGEPRDVLVWRDDLPYPVPEPGQVVVKVLGAACNFPDILMCRGAYQDSPSLPFVPGLEVAGEVVEVTPGAAAHIGDRVVGTPPVGRGGYASHAVLDRAATVPWPTGMSAGQAAASFVTYQTALFALQVRGRLAPGETVLVHAAAGGIGSAAVQIARALGAEVIAAAGGPAKCDVALRLGAAYAVDYVQDDVVSLVKELTDGRGVDVVVDPVGGDLFDASRRVMASEGRLLVIGFAGGRIADAPTNHVLLKNYDVVGVHWGPYRDRAPEKIGIWQAEINRLWENGLIDPLVGAELPMAEAADALVLLGARETIGKVVLLPDRT